MHRFFYSLYFLSFLGCSLNNKTIILDSRPWDKVELIEISSSDQIDLIFKDNNVSIAGEWYINIPKRERIKKLKDITKTDLDTIKKHIFTESNSTIGYVFVRDDSDKARVLAIDEHILFNEIYYFSITSIP